MKIHCMLFATLLSGLAIISIANGANIELYVNTSQLVQVPRDISNTYGFKFCIRSAKGASFSLAPTYGVYDQAHRFTFEIGAPGPNFTIIRPSPTSQYSSKNLEKDLVNINQDSCFWVLWPDNHYYVGKGSVWGEKPLMYYRNASQSSFAGLWVNANKNIEAYVTILDEIISKADAQAAGALSLYVPATYAGPVKKTNSPNEVTTVSVTTAAGAPYQTLPIDLSGVKEISMSITPDSTKYGALIALCDRNNPDTANSCYEFNPYRYQFMFTQAKGIGISKMMQENSNAYDYYTIGSYPYGTYKQFWLSWKNGRIAAGMGETTGEQTVLSWDDATPFTVNSVMIMSNDILMNWKIPQRYYG